MMNIKWTRQNSRIFERLKQAGSVEEIKLGVTVGAVVDYQFLLD